jgi:hypothetical protein
MNGEHKSAQCDRTEEKRTRWRDERNGAERCWIYRDGYHYAQVTFDRPDRRLYPNAVEYMRVLSRQEIEKIAGDGVDVMQMVNSLHRTVEGQWKHIAKLQKIIERLVESGAPLQGDEVARG